MNFLTIKNNPEITQSAIGGPLKKPQKTVSPSTGGEKAFLTSVHSVYRVVWLVIKTSPQPSHKGRWLVV